MKTHLISFNNTLVNMSNVCRITRQPPSKRSGESEFRPRIEIDFIGGIIKEIKFDSDRELDIIWERLTS